VGGTDAQFMGDRSTAASSRQEEKEGGLKPLLKNAF